MQRRFCGVSGGDDRTHSDDFIHCRGGCSFCIRIPTVPIIVQGAMEDPVNGFAGFAVPAVGAVVYYIFDRKIKKEAKGNE